MKAVRDTNRLQGSTEGRLVHTIDRAVRFASDVKSRWHKGAVPDANAILSEHPYLLRYRSLVLDLAVEEYKCRQESGEPISSDEFAVRFPGMEKSLYFLLEVQRMLKQDSLLGMSSEEIVWPQVGEDFLGFSLLAELGQGTFGHVFLASEPSLGSRLVALKVAPQGQWEAEILGKLSHPNIVPVYSIQRDPETELTAVCMPYLGRVTLQDAIERIFAHSKIPRNGEIFATLLKDLNERGESPFSGDLDLLLTRGTYLDSVVHLGIQLADALAFTHGQGIYHRDLKPSNILLSNNGRPLILDFNLSVDEEISPARIGGTLPYMAPEQLQCLLADSAAEQASDPALSDLFSLGVILYELLTGTLPFGMPNMSGDWDDAALDLLARHQRGPRPVQEVNPNVDGKLACLIEGCLSFDPQRRPASAESIADSLRGHQSLYRRTNRWIRRHPFAIVSGAISVVLCIALFGTWLTLRDPYPVRLYREGLSSLQRGQSTEAIERFNAALQASPDNKDIRMERGKAYYRAGKFSQALDDFERVSAVDPTGEAVALQGHCLCQGKHYPEAILGFNDAIAAGYERSSLFNNLGYCYFRTAELSEAEESLRKAISMNPRCSTIWCNLIRVTTIQFDQKKIILSQAAKLIKNALDAEQPTADLFFYTAGLESRLAKSDPSFIPHVFEHLRKAISLGADPRQIAREAAFKPLRDQKEFSALLELTPGSRVPGATDGIMSPF